MTFTDRIHFKKAIIVYKLFNSSGPQYLNSMFSYKQPSSDLNLRSKEKGELFVPKPRIEFSRKSLSYSGPMIWNAIPSHLRFSENL